MNAKMPITLIAAGLLGVAGMSNAWASYPERPVTMIVAYSAGGGTDVAARTLAPYIEEHLGQSITVLNKPGAGGEIGFTALAQAEPDGYTFGFINIPNMLAIPIQREARYSMDDIDPVAQIVYDAGALSVRSDSEIDSLEELVAEAKENPGTVTYGTTGIGSDDHLAVLSFERKADIKLRHIPFPGAADLRAATLGGHITMASMNMSESVDDMEAGNLRILGQMAEERWESAPEVPTFQEQGYDVVMGSHRGIGAPADLPEDVFAALSSAVEKAVADPEFQEKSLQQGLPISYQGPAEFDAQLDMLNDELLELWKDQPWAQTN
ncbi:tripartite tricarboxylate transporter substrate binding protein [Halomonas daqiaonensis]|uniref:Tripartite-type tricarboxylate transporter, receptor component TctC n=1 Tax=Halomonas daqiaonensis TaxID=650850 RepID=A0A1H7V9Q0_9GAMM|nr:tripartite tricarboxylate transporter substrate binding protein [Halomonas daqiaonensis]SEM05993.1 Tripartite-type tricarboxylate transporter, receptor component TctC [Halomonas daqiaonensis]